MHRVIVHDISAEEAQLLSDHHMRNGDLLVWAVFDHPCDYPSSWVCRPSTTRHGPVPLDVVLRAPTLAKLREMAPAGLTIFARQAGDPPFLHETWI